MQGWRVSLTGRTRMIVFPGRRSVGLKAATASSRVETLPMFVRSRPSRTRRTISISWARSDSTTKSTVKPSAGRASVGPAMVTRIPRARISQPWRGRVQTRWLARRHDSLDHGAFPWGYALNWGGGKTRCSGGLFPHPAKPLRISLHANVAERGCPGGKTTSLLPPEEDIRRRIEHVCLVPTFSSDRPATSQLTIVKYQFDSQTAFLNDAS